MTSDWMELDTADHAHLDALAVAGSDGFLVVQSGPRSWTLYARVRQDVEGFSGLEPGGLPFACGLSP
jgi:hypothetical protein